jgi:type III pantothenate kinase
MLLAIDIGNSTMKFGIFKGPEPLHRFAIPTHRDYAKDELLFDRLKYIEDRFITIDRVVVSSVVPEVEEAVSESCRQLLKVTPLYIDHSFDLGMKVSYDPIASLGIDRLVNAVAAVEEYGAPCIVCSFGTATTIDAVTKDSEFLGGAILPGMSLAAESLYLRTAKLPKIKIEKPRSAIGTNTDDAIRSGVFFGQVGAIEYLINRIASEMAAKPAVISTGGFAGLLNSTIAGVDHFDENLALTGIRLVAEKNPGS